MTTNSHLSHIKDYLQLARPEQWIKNMFVFLPLFFSGRASFLPNMWSTLVAFISFSLMASAIYCINDVADRDTDRRHPRKCRRPIASGKVSIHGAIIFATMLIIGSTALTLVSGNPASLIMVLAIYLVINLLYTFKLKQVQVVDIFIIASGFVLRLLAGSAVCDITLSCWIVIVTFALAMFLAMAKRRSDLMIMLRTNDVQRRSLVGYTQAFVDASLGILGVSPSWPISCTRYHPRLCHGHPIFMPHRYLWYWECSATFSECSPQRKVAILSSCFSPTAGYCCQ